MPNQLLNLWFNRVNLHYIKDYNLKQWPLHPVKWVVYFHNSVTKILIYKYTVKKLQMPSPSNMLDRQRDMSIHLACHFPNNFPKHFTLLILSYDTPKSFIIWLNSTNIIFFLYFLKKVHIEKSELTVWCICMHNLMHLSFLLRKVLIT